MGRSSFGYLFERFPSFTQTFCYREVAGMRARLGAGQGDVPVFSIRDPRDEPVALDCGGVEYLPGDFTAELERAGFRREARRWLAELVRVWGDEGEKRRVYEALWLLPRLRALGVGHVHVHFAGIAARTAFWLRRIGGVTYTLTAHANDIFRDEPEDRLRMLLEEAEGVVTVSDFSVRALRERFPSVAGRVVRVYNGVAMAEFRPADFAAVPPRIVSVGRCIAKKGFGDLIAACGRLEPGTFAAEIVGSGPLEAELRGQIAVADLAGSVVMAGARSQAEIVDRLAGAAVFALPCVDLPDGAKDNLPTVIMEAMAAGLPVVSTRVAGVPEMVIDGETGWLVPERDPAALAERLAELLADPALARRMGAAGRARCAELFALERTTESLESALATWGVRFGRAGAPKRRWWERLRG